MTMLNDFLSISATWGVLLTLAAFALGTLINHETGKAVFNPLLLGTVFVIVFLSVCGIPYASYKASASPVNYLLLPATVSLAVPLYEKWDLLRKNVLAIVMGILAGTLASLGSVLVLSLLLRLDHSQYITLLPKSVTTAISMDVSKELGGIAALTGAQSHIRVGGPFAVPQGIRQVFVGHLFALLQDEVLDQHRSLAGLFQCG